MPNEQPMKLVSDTLRDGAPLPPEHALGVQSADGPVPGKNLSPALSWSGAPPGTRAFVVTCIDPDAPTRKDDANKPDRTIPASFPRGDFVHWLLVDVPAELTGLPAGIDGQGIVPRGKPPAATRYGLRGVNDYTSWFAGDGAMEGDYAGYDGAWPPFNDAIPHRYVYTVYAVDVASLGLRPGFRGPELKAALAGHVLAEASITCTYTLNTAL
jgi:Raf kinase inhibitor-like YbhB/YbcL family protein